MNFTLKNHVIVNVDLVIFATDIRVNFSYLSRRKTIVDKDRF